MIFVLIILERGQVTGEEFYFRELTSCLEYSAALDLPDAGNAVLLATASASAFSNFADSICAGVINTSLTASTIAESTSPKKLLDGVSGVVGVLGGEGGTINPFQGKIPGDENGGEPTEELYDEDGNIIWDNTKSI